jgi:hypothetical protein
MTRDQSRRRRRSVFEIKRIVAWVLMVAFEILVAAVPTATAAAFLLPFAYQERGYFGVGGEWLMIVFVFCLVYAEVHKAIRNRFLVGRANEGLLQRQSGFRK